MGVVKSSWVWLPNSLPVILSLLTVSLVFASETTKPKTVSTLLNAKWPEPPVALEISEFLHDEDATYFWDFVDQYRKPGSKSPKTEKQDYEELLTGLQKQLSPSQISLLRFMLSLHIYAPKVEMFHQIAASQNIPPNCRAVVEIHGEFTCKPEEIKVLLGTSSEKAAETYKLDHFHQPYDSAKKTAILYGELGSEDFVTFHNALKELSYSGKINYVLRHYVKERSKRKLRLAGYGVELQIKSTEYKAQDDTKVQASATKSGEVEGTTSSKDEEDVEGFLFGKLKSLHPNDVDKLEKFRQSLVEETHELAPLKVWQLQELSLQAAERILSSPRDEALKIMMHLAQNFPLQARSLIRTTVKQALKKEVKANRATFLNELNLQPSDTALFVNGMFFDMDASDIFTLLDHMREELKITEGLHQIGVEPQFINQFLSLDLSAPAQEYAVDIRDSAVVYVNDVEKDSQYRRWSSSLSELLRPTYPGMLRSIRKNLYHLVVIADPSKRSSRSIVKLAESFYLHNAPLKIGLVFAVNPDRSVTGYQDGGVALLNAFNYVAEQMDNYKGLSFITDVYAAVGADRDITPQDVEKMLKTKYNLPSAEDILGEDSDYDFGRQLAKDFVQGTGLKGFPQVLLNGVPLDKKMLEKDEFEEAVLSEIMKQTPVLQKAVFKNELTDSDNVLDYLMTRSNVMPRLNDRILHGESKEVDLTGKFLENWSEDSSHTAKKDVTATVAKVMSYLSGKDPNIKLTPVTTWLVANFETSQGQTLLQNALQHLDASTLMRIGLIQNGAGGPVSQAIQAILSRLPFSIRSSTLKKLLEPNFLKDLQAGSRSFKDMNLEDSDLNRVESFGAEEWATLSEWHKKFASEVLGLKKDDIALVVNGKLMGPLDEDETMTLLDFQLLERHTMSVSGEKISQVVKQAGLNPGAGCDLAMHVSALLAAKTSTKARHELNFKKTEHSMLNLPAKREDLPSLDIVAIMDPLSAGAQRLIPLLLVFQEVFNVNIRVFFNCVEKHSEMPLKSFYRMALEPDLLFSAEGKLLAGPVVKFGVLPSEALLTQNLVLPDNWLVEPVLSPYDIDNIRLNEAETDVHSEFELESLLLEGHCFEQSSSAPPRGLQLTLGTSRNPTQVDTIVMANLGYLQLKANPGAWILRLREGRSSDLYDIVSLDGVERRGNETEIKVLMSSFKSHVMKLKVQKKPGKEMLDLLSDDEGESSGIWNSITSTFSGKVQKDEEDEKLNIFSLASGHLYERFLRIMMLSVVKHTKAPVKFWFLKNYLSPTFKDFLPVMAQKYGFEYELVQYKWPRWLHQQKEKQRIIWGYKILFLDVLFPLSVKKIIFVDADQVVRTDLTELRDLDLGGAPYGYTPFCDSRKEMDGFRFWKSGYWRNHLQGRKYHISALYVVDLKRFRRIAAGDRLRGQYQALSQDPNSLANLDQDLPNNMIHQVPIKSLPQEWLWCETWCDEASKKTAKTIDLCNNPMTKEAKLDAAVRILGEWTSYDTEIKKVQEQAASQSRSTTGSTGSSHDAAEL